MKRGLLARALVLLLGGCVDAFNPRPIKLDDARDALADVQWKRRLLVFWGPEFTNTEWKKQQTLFLPSDAHSFSDECAARDLDVIGLTHFSGFAAIGQRRVGADDLRRSLDLPADRFEVVLVGKDGQVKQREHLALTPQDVFKTIDAMPMRQQEMRDGK